MLDQVTVGVSMSVSGGIARSGEIQLWAVGLERCSVVNCRKLVALGALISDDVVTVIDEIRSDWL